MTQQNTVVNLECLKHYEATGQRPAGYVDEYYEMAEYVDEEHGLLWLTREAQDKLIAKYRVEDTPERRAKADELRRQIQEKVEQKKRADESEEDAMMRLHDDPEIKHLREQMPRLAPDASGVKIDSEKIRRGLGNKKSVKIRSDGRRDYTDCVKCKEKMLKRMKEKNQ